MSQDGAFSHLHVDARHTLEQWRTPDPRQLDLRDQYLVFLDEHPDAMARECRIGHLTASALVMNASRTHVLLTLHPKVGRWLQLGGHCEAADLTLRDAAIREAIEEGGIAEVRMSAMPIQLDRHPVKCWDEMSEHLDVQYLATVPDGSVPVISEESDDLRWFALDALPEGIDDSMRSLVSAAMQGNER
jgi:8-oxo-dGTP pyrophosphatase MutT (NUDIX family)